MSDIISKDKFCERPHLVILGAGATVATIPFGDKNGRKASCMNNFIEELDMGAILDGVRLHTTSTNLEDIYSELHDRTDCTEVREILEHRIYDYFRSLELPDQATIYDLLILSLRPKDCIATFNWDGLLVDAYNRVKKITGHLPNLIFLHGNVNVSYCPNCDSYGNKRETCPRCKKKTIIPKLLYPIKHKDYTSDPFIKRQWEDFEAYLEDCSILTIFGYSAPKTDVEAIEKLQKAFARLYDNRFLDHIEIIEKPGFNRTEISEAWLELSSHTHEHISLMESFYDSYLAQFPRRSIEGYFKSNIEGWWGDPTISFTRGITTLDAVHTLIQPLIEDERMNTYEII